MSIIADTLKRLQTRPAEPIADESKPSSQRPIFNQGEGSGRHRQSSGQTFWLIGVFMTVGIGGLALSTYWIGWHLDFDISPDTHARTTMRHPVPTSPLPLEIEANIPKSSDIMDVTTPEPAQTTTMTSNEVNDQLTKQTAVTTIDSSTGQELLTVPIMSTSDSSMPHTSQDEQDQPSTPELSNEEDGTLNSAEETEPKEDTAGLALEEPLPKQEMDPMSAEEPSAETGEPQPTTPMVAGLTKEVVYPEIFLKTSKNSENPPQITQRLANLKAQREAMAVTGRPPQPSSVSRLRHARHLIQSGEYEDAVALLSPLFHDPPVQWQPWFWMGTALLGQGDAEQADQFFLSGLARNDKIPQLWIQRALVAQQRGDYQLAIHELRQAESLEAGLPHIHLNMGYAYEQLGNDRLANQYYGNF